MIKSARLSCVLSVASDQRSSGRFALQRTIPTDPFGGIGSSKVANSIRGVGKFNPAGRVYHEMSNMFFGNIAPYTGSF